MASTIFSNAQRIIAQILEWTQISGQTKTNDLILDTFSAGIDNATTSGEGFLIVPGTNNTSATPTVNCTLESIAYDSLGNRIFIDASDVTLYNASNINDTTNDGLGNFLSTPQSTGVVNIPVTQTSQNYIWINYLATIDTSAFTLNAETNAKIFYKQTDGYNIQVTTTNVPPNASSIFLASVNMLGGGAVAPSNISQVGRTYYQILPNIVPITTPLSDNSDRTPQYAPASTYTLEAHIKSVGTGTGISPFNPHNQSLADFGVGQFDTVQAHRQLEHGVNGSGPGSATDVNNAVIAGTPTIPYPSTSAMACEIIIATSDYILVHQLLSSEFAIINGTAYNVTSIFGAIPTDASVTFPNASGTYNVYYDSITKVFATTTSSIATDPTKLWLCTVTYTYVGVLGHNALSSLLERRRIGSTTERYQRWVTTARPPNPISGEYGFNLDINAPEWFDGTAWQSTSSPTASMIDFAGMTAPAGWLLCDGSAISRTTFSNLFNLIGITWGPGDGSTTFNIPDMRRRVSVGSGGTGSGVLGNTVGNVGGAESVTPTQNPHTHTENPHIHRQDTDATVNINPGGNIGVYASGSGSYGSAEIIASNTAGGNPYTRLLAQTQTQSDTGMSSTTATNNASSVIQPSAIVSKIIKY